MSTSGTNTRILGVSETSSLASDRDGREKLVRTNSQWEEEWTARDTASVRLQLLGRVLCCRNKPRIRWIRSKGAILVLLWNCLILSSYGVLGLVFAEVLQLSSVLSDREIYLVLTLVEALSEMLLYPLAGWIADVYFGRYRVMKTSLWLMWTGTVLLSSCFCINNLLPPTHGWIKITLTAVPYLVAVLVMEAGIAGIFANVIPFGIDQLLGSGDQLSGFITWYVFTNSIKWSFLTFPFSCLPMDSPSYNVLLQLLFQAVLLSAALILDSFCRGWFIMEPHTSNPFKLVASVLRYAWKNKEPQFRSAFTYQDHTKPSRIEFAKESFGGPFTTEQVEDVKTFLKIVLALVPIGGTLVLSIFLTDTVKLFSQHIDSHDIPCYGYQAMTVYFAYFTVVCAVPLYEFLIRPVMRNYIPTTLTRIGMGVILNILSSVALFTIDLVGHERETSGTNYNSTCLYDEATQEVNRLHINPLWAMLPAGLNGLGIFFNFTAVYEFVFSQSPYNMKGLLMGAVYATTGSGLLLGLALQVPFYLGYVDHLTTVPSCGSVYLLVWLALTIVWLTVYVKFARGYRKRERGKTIRQQDYTEEYYSKYLSINPP